MKYVRTILALALGYCLVIPVVASADDQPDFSSNPAFANCTRVTTRVGVKNSGRFGWKPKAAHFNAVVIVGPRRYNRPVDPKGPPRADVYSAATGRKIFPRLRVKSHSNCAGIGEDLCATTWLTPNRFTGDRIESRFGAVIVRITAAAGSDRGCRYYYVAEPSKRVQYKNM